MVISDLTIEKRNLIPGLESFEDNAAREWQPALTGQTAKSRNLVLIWLENPVDGLFLARNRYLPRPEWSGLLPNRRCRLILIRENLPMRREIYTS